jgi:hypothetical protein
MRPRDARHETLSDEEFTIVLTSEPAEAAQSVFFDGDAVQLRQVSEKRIYKNLPNGKLFACGIQLAGDLQKKSFQAGCGSPERAQSTRAQGRGRKSV